MSIDEIVLKSIYDGDFLRLLPAKMRDFVKSQKSPLELNIDMLKRLAWLETYKSSKAQKMNIPYRATLEEFCIDFDCWRCIYIGSQINRLFRDLKCDIDIMTVEYSTDETNNDDTIKAIEKCKDDQTCILLEHLITSPKNATIFTENHQFSDVGVAIPRENLFYLYYQLLCIHTICDIYLPKKMIKKEQKQCIFINYTTPFVLNVDFLYVLTDFQAIGGSANSRAFIKSKSGPAKMHTIYEAQRKKFGQVSAKNDYISVTNDKEMIDFIASLDDTWSSREIFDAILTAKLPKNNKNYMEYAEKINKILF